jgi:4-aminobutyrate--pyruvate transaminase
LKALGQHPLVGEARGLGLIGGVELVADKTSKRSFAPQHGVGARSGALRRTGRPDRALGCGDVLTLSPPLIIAPRKSRSCSTDSRRALDKTLDWVTRERLTQA